MPVIIPKQKQIANYQLLLLYFNIRSSSATGIIFFFRKIIHTIFVFPSALLHAIKHGLYVKGQNKTGERKFDYPMLYITNQQNQFKRFENCKISILLCIIVVDMFKIKLKDFPKD